jgi:hypothetical protein
MLKLIQEPLDQTKKHIQLKSLLGLEANLVELKRRRRVKILFLDRLVRRHLRRKGVSGSLAAGLFVVGLLIGAVAVYGLASAGYFASQTTVTSTVGGTVTTTVGGTVSTSTVTFTLSGTAGGGLCNGQTITIGALNDLSGELSSQGQEDFLKEQLAI